MLQQTNTKSVESDLLIHYAFTQYYWLELHGVNNRVCTHRTHTSYTEGSCIPDQCHIHTLLKCTMLQM